VSYRQNTKSKEEAEAVKKGLVKEDSRPALFRQVILYGNLPASELTVERLTKEAQVIVGAGSVTVSRIIDFIAVCVLSRPHVRIQLAEELRDIMSGFRIVFRRT